MTLKIAEEPELFRFTRSHDSGLTVQIHRITQVRKADVVKFFPSRKTNYLINLPFAGGAPNWEKQLLQEHPISKHKEFVDKE